jgi:hypothetical protein
MINNFHIKEFNDMAFMTSLLNMVLVLSKQFNLTDGSNSILQMSLVGTPSAK